MLLSLHTNKYYLPQEENKAPTVGFEPTTFGLEVQRASPLRHAGLLESVQRCLIIDNTFV